uniref:Uncharacterized protein n=1 Tax=Macrostomum lignano TaxID=282301 RepID=A0A1I8HZ51_9PLAT
MSGRGGEKIRYAKQEIPHVLQSARNRAAAAAAADASGPNGVSKPTGSRASVCTLAEPITATSSWQQQQQQKTARLAAGAADSAAAYTRLSSKQQQQRSRTAAPPRKGWAPGDQDITIRTQTGDLSILQLGGGGNGDSNEDDASQIDEEELLPPPSGSTDDNDGSDVLDANWTAFVGGGGASSDARVVLQLRKSLGPAYDEGHKLDYIIQRIMELSVGQRDKLMQAFAHIDQQQQQPAKSAANLANEAIAEANQPPKQQPAAQAAVGHVIRLRLHSNWGTQA